MPQKTIEQVLQENGPRLMSIEGVVGVAQSLCEGQDCLQVYATADSKKLRQEIPDKIDGYPVQIVITGDIKALDKN